MQLATHFSWPLPDNHNNYEILIIFSWQFAHFFPISWQDRAWELDIPGRWWRERWLINKGWKKSCQQLLGKDFTSTWRIILRSKTDIVSDALLLFSTSAIYIRPWMESSMALWDEMEMHTNLCTLHVMVRKREKNFRCLVT